MIYIGTEHLLLGMIREGEGVAVPYLRNLAVPMTNLKGRRRAVPVKGTANHNVKNMQIFHPDASSEKKWLKLT